MRRVNEAINHELGYSVPLFQKSLSSSFESLWVVGGQQSSSLLERPKRCSIDLHVWRTRWSFHSYDSFLEKRKSSTRSEDLIPMSASSQRSISNDVEVCAPVNGDATIQPTLPHRQIDTFVHERRITPTATVSPDENTPIIRMNRKTDSSEKRTLIHSFPPVHMLVAHSCGYRRDDALMLV
ncbi:hypothetical protein TNCV_4051641 [Trichonephila clavipes]|nr:hypothetical protein TNCV_4051641 [Trichonephila clavipes]